MAFNRSKIGKHSWNNCLTWALWQWWKYGGYFLIRRAGKRQQSWYVHFMWLPNLESKPLHFTSENNFPWPIFRGYVKEGDWDETDKKIKRTKRTRK